ncbi:ATP-binding protein [Pelistega sp. MC2]|uniref:ATP-binding protein n=1 Tax=Pelistega sp. MC2 TaxID=1720297 RepID=UPI0008DB0370|nr:ATP-binding protein [Pelistega sp. MC2]
MNNLKNFLLSIRAQILLMMFGTIILVQSAVFYVGNYLKEKVMEDVVSGQITTTIKIIRNAITNIPPDMRAAFIHDASEGKWQLRTIETPKSGGPIFSIRRDDDEEDDLDDLPSNRPPPPHALDQIFPHLKEHIYRHLNPATFSRFSDKKVTETPVKSALRQDIQKLISSINRKLDDGTRISLIEEKKTPLLFLSLLPEYNPFNDTVIREWLVIPVANIEPDKNGIFFLAWLTMTTLLLVFAGYFAWRITKPLHLLSQSTDYLAKGDFRKVTPSGPSETRILGERFNAMLSSLEQAKTVQQTLLAGLPHDLKGPLARMKLRLEMCDDQVLQSGMSNDVQEMQNIVEQFISYVRGADPTRYRFEPINLTNWIDERAHAWSASSDVMLTSNTKHPVFISGDTLALGRLLDNLISNALKHGKPPVEISLSKHHQFAKISVADHGNGIPADRREEALRAFSRLDSARTKTGSVGLGLALVDNIVQAHHGKLTLGSHSSGGLLVEIELPLIAANKH